MPPIHMLKFAIATSRTHAIFKCERTAAADVQP
jgi:hypothetical protein